MTSAADDSGGADTPPGTDERSVSPFPSDRELRRLQETFRRLTSSGALDQIRRQRDDVARSVAGMLTGFNSSGALDQIRRQQDDVARSVAGMLTELNSSGGLGQLRRQQDEIRELFLKMAADPGLRQLGEQNQRIASLVGQLSEGEGFAVYESLDGDATGGPAMIPESLPVEVGEAAELLASVNEALPAGEEASVEAAATAEVLALLCALVWVSGWVGFWLQEAVRTQAPGLGEMNRAQLVMDLFFLGETTKGLHSVVQAFIRRHLPDRRVRLREVKPYAIVDDLDQLRGPDGGVVELSHSVLWAPGDSCVDLDEPGGTVMAYQAVLAEGAVEDLEQVLHRGRLIKAWPYLMLDRRVREMWESRFPELQPQVDDGRSS